jgi:hypothetical protein
VSQITVSAVDCCLSVSAVECFQVLLNETIIFGSSGRSFTLLLIRRLFMFLFCLCYFMLLILVFRGFLESNRRFILHVFVISDFLSIPINHEFR